MKAMLLALAAVMAADLAKVADQSTVNLVTIGRKSGAPRTATIWFVADGGKIYVQAGKGGTTDWFKNLQKNPAVTLEFSEVRLQGKAEVVDDPAETQRVHDLFRKKYWLARAASWVGAGIGSGRVVRIEPSSAGAG
jgi:deazaflavin-dependent oxidoreductase (nitroreductase family)